MWRRKQLPWQETGLFSPDPSEIEWAKGQEAEGIGSFDDALQYLRDRKQQCDLLQEGIFEASRPSHLPSRQRCLFCWDDRHDFAADAGEMRVDREKRLIEIVPVVGESTIHRAPLSAMDGVRLYPDPVEISARAKVYWAGAEPGPRIEVLLIGWYEVVGHR